MDIDPTRAPSLSAARLAAHHAAALLAEFAFTWIEHDPAFSFANLGWDDGVLFSREAGGIQIGLHIADLRWIVRRDGGEIASLDVRSGEEAHGWLLAQATAAGLEARPIVSPSWDMPAKSESAADDADLQQLSDWFALAQVALTEVAARHDGASEVRIWPHHFDIATLITLDEGADAETARSVGVGLSPGDGGIDEPYFYVTPWPYPDSKAGPKLPWNGYWHTQGWFGAVLKGTNVVEDGVPEMFLRMAVDGAHRILDRTKETT